MKIRQILLILLTLPLFFGCSPEDMSDNEDFILNLPPMKAHFTQFMVGNIFNPNDVNSSTVVNSFLTHHFNVLTCENHMKPSYLAPSKGSYNFTTADSMVNAARASGFKVVGHTLLWHSQNPSSGWMNSASLTDMKKYITDVVGHFKGKIYSWDVLNEVFPDGGYTNDWKTSMRNENPWFKTIGYSFVYEGFLAARLADPDAILYYNDYNTDMASKAKMIYDMVKEVNDKYLTSSDKPAGEPAGRLLIEGIGMQEHHNLGITAQRIKATIDLFKTLNVAGRNNIKLSVSELDIIAFQNYSAFSSAGGAGANKDLNSGSPGDSALTTQAKLFSDYMKLYIANADIIERVSLWGVTDDQSWRSLGRPLLFDRNGLAKPAYHEFVGALVK